MGKLRRNLGRGTKPTFNLLTTTNYGVPLVLKYVDNLRSIAVLDDTRLFEIKTLAQELGGEYLTCWR